ncbi:MAG: SUMF1/EgtB/PvdO family nonheme iron enzyme [Planctomycetales bacterium]|nr:SUMF1/EgtB/PvdO family nonheme iron enzyme [Planctomycetales bacterium]
MRTFAFMLLVAVAAANVVRADVFGSGADTFEIEFVTIGDPGNPADTTGAPNPAGSVPYQYRIGKFEVSEAMVDIANSMSYLRIVHDDRGPNKPVTQISWYEAARFVNWLNTTNGHPPAYKFVANRGLRFELWQPGDPGYNPANAVRNSLAFYFLPSTDEWYKAAYYDPTSGAYYDYATGSDISPTAVASGSAAGTSVYGQPHLQGPADITLAGGLSPYGTMAQGGNAFEWEETEFDLVNDMASSVRGTRGASWGHSSDFLRSSVRTPFDPGLGASDVGFRVASRIPEPSTLLLGLVGFGLLLRTKRASP